MLRIGQLAWLGPSSQQVLKKSMTGSTRRCDSSVLICWLLRRLAMVFGNSTREAESCRMLVAKWATPVYQDSVGQLRAAKTTVPACREQFSLLGA